MLLPDYMPMDISIDDLTPFDAFGVAMWLLDHDLAVPLDIIIKAHSGGFYFAH